jgi:hypothetical protein
VYANNFEVKTFKKINKLKLSVIKGSRYKDTSYQQLEFGSYYKLPYKQKIGFFIIEASGIRHTDDCIVDSGDWIWKDTSDRKEYLKQFVYSKRFRTSSLSSITYELKNTYHQARIKIKIHIY